MTAAEGQDANTVSEDGHFSFPCLQGDGQSHCVWGEAPGPGRRAAPRVTVGRLCPADAGAQRGHRLRLLRAPPLNAFKILGVSLFVSRERRCTLVGSVGTKSSE